MSDDDGDDKRSTVIDYEAEVQAHSGGVETFATPEEDITLVVRMIPPTPGGDTTMVDVSIRSSLLGGRLMMEPERAERLGEELVDAADRARTVELPTDTDDD
jgi:hypothetical protein